MSLLEYFRCGHGAFDKSARGYVEGFRAFAPMRGVGSNPDESRDNT
jgi:hypothetical protein